MHEPIDGGQGHGLFREDRAPLPERLVGGDEVMAAAMLDRLLHRCHVVNIQGTSYRMREYKAARAHTRRNAEKAAVATLPPPSPAEDKVDKSGTFKLDNDIRSAPARSAAPSQSADHDPGRQLPVAHQTPRRHGQQPRSCTNNDLAEMIDHHDDRGEKNPRATTSGLFRRVKDLNIPPSTRSIFLSFAGPFFSPDTRWDHAGAGQAELAHPRQPDAVGDVGLVPLELLDLVRVHQRHGDARVFERLERGLPVHAGAFHQDGVHPMALEPGAQGGQARGQRAECLRQRRRGAARRLAANGGRDLHLVHIQTSRTGMDDREIVRLKFVG